MCHEAETLHVDAPEEVECHIIDVAGLPAERDRTVGKDTGDRQLAVPQSRPVHGNLRGSPDQHDPPTLARQGHAVLSVDSSTVGLRKAGELAAEAW